MCDPAADRGVPPAPGHAVRTALPSCLSRPPSLVGVGDLSGDGRADLPARDTAGKLWRYSGTGTGLYGTRVAVGTGWGTFKGLS
ncbi:hypothetical protein [Streptomyces globisporus]|uniref:hypothetical protein n=1 Tax=Streptomyces globisporus TaxID=1908 RepID=UPI0004CA9CBA|nr:hypothetical protein [Streptomyces globisporus]